VLDLEGIMTDSYSLTYDELFAHSGCALLYKGQAKADCSGTPDQKVKMGDPLKLPAGDTYWDVKHAETS